MSTHLELRDALLAVAKNYYGTDLHDTQEDENQNNYNRLFSLLCDTARVVTAEGLHVFGNFGADDAPDDTYSPSGEWTLDEVEIAMTLGPVVANICPNFEITPDSCREIFPV